MLETVNLKAKLGKEEYRAAQEALDRLLQAPAGTARGRFCC